MAVESSTVVSSIGESAANFEHVRPAAGVTFILWTVVKSACPFVTIRAERVVFAVATAFVPIYSVNSADNLSVIASAKRGRILSLLLRSIPSQALRLK